MSSDQKAIDHILAPLVHHVNSAPRCGKKRHSHNRRMDRKELSKRAKITPEHEEESKRLKALFKARARESQEDFGAKYEIGSQGMVWQYLNARAGLCEPIRPAASAAQQLVRIRDASTSRLRSRNSQKWSR